MTTPDPIDDVRAELARVAAPSEGDLAAQRAQLEDVIAQTTTPARVKRRRIRRLIPASGVAVASVAIAAFVVFALQPDGGRDSNGSDPASTGLRLATGTPGGAFAGLNLDTASAADVLRAAGDAAADGMPEPGPHDWTYTRSESGGADLPTSMNERWTSPDGERSYGISSIAITDPDLGEVGRHYSVHYEYLKLEILGDVSWTEQEDGSRERRANWHTDSGDGSGEIKRMVKLTELLRSVRTAEDVQEALDESIDGAKLRFQNGFACGTEAKYSSCSGSGLLPQAQGLTDAESKRLYLTGQLITVMLGNVFPKDATRAIYEHLAALPEATVASANDESGDVILSLRVKGPSYTTRRLENNGPGVGYESRPNPGTKFNTKAVAVIDPDTGRLVQLNPTPTMGDMTTRYTKFGVAPAPALGSTVCEEFANACAEITDLERRLESDPDAQFKGVVDWMFISQFCDGMINRDGTPNQDTDLPRSMSKDPKVKAEREACEQREAAAARGD